MPDGVRDEERRSSRRVGRVSISGRLFFGDPKTVRRRDTAPAHERYRGNPTTVGRSGSVRAQSLERFFGRIEYKNERQGFIPYVQGTGRKSITLSDIIVTVAQVYAKGKKKSINHLFS